MATATKKTPNLNDLPQAQDATALLRADHNRVRELFADYEKMGSTSKQKLLVSHICAELTVHAQIEEEIFYPAIKGVVKDTELIAEATVEHTTLKDLIAQVEGVEPHGEIFDAKIKVMAEYVKHHVREEENEMFPLAKSSSLDMRKLGARLSERKAKLLAQRA
jgi:hemerythrin superfamily protein